jgi:hypothetical protein
MVIIKFLLSLLFIIYFSNQLFSFSGNGSGTKDDPYQISNVQQLQEISHQLDAHYILMNDIDASETKDWNVGDHDNNPSTPNEPKGFDPIGSHSNSSSNVGFTGSLNGNGYKISDITINRPQESMIGVFGVIESNVSILDINIVNATIVGKAQVGILAGFAGILDIDDSISISGCHTSGDIVAGNNMSSCFIGDVFIENGKLSLSNSEATGGIIGDSYLGGFIGNLTTSGGSIEIFNCKANSTINGSGSNVGGFIGYIRADNKNSNIIIRSSTCNAEIYSSANTGGFAGRVIADDVKSKVLINFCECTSNIYSQTEVGGFCGQCNAGHGVVDISVCKSYGIVEGWNDVGGFCGINLPGQPDSEIRISNCSSYCNVVGDQYIGGFCGTNKGGEYGGLSYIFNSFCHCKVNGSQNVGGFCAYNGTERGNGIAKIENCFSDIDLESNYNAGGFCCDNRSDHDGTAFISKCYSTGHAKANFSVGGFVSSNSGGNSSIIENSYSRCDLDAGIRVGGFCSTIDTKPNGNNTSLITNCYYAGTIQAESDIFGFCATKYYGTGILKVKNCYWDMELSGVTESIAGSGRGTADMKTQSTFQNWEFDNIWSIHPDINDGYPHLIDIYTLDLEDTGVIKNNFTVYPNPTTDKININANNGIISKVRIIGILGRVVAEADVNGSFIEISVGGLPYGLYIVQVLSVSRMHSYPIVIK